MMTTAEAIRLRCEPMIQEAIDRLVESRRVIFAIRVDRRSNNPASAAAFICCGDRGGIFRWRVFVCLYDSQAAAVLLDDIPFLVLCGNESIHDIAHWVEQRLDEQ